MVRYTSLLSFLMLAFCCVTDFSFAESSVRLGLEPEATKAVKISLRDIPLPPGTVLVNDNTLRVLSGVNANIVVDVTPIISAIPHQKLWLRAEVKSSRQRSDILYNNSERAFFSYHNGDGTSQILISEVLAPREGNRANISLISSESNDLNGEVDIGPIVLSLEKSDSTALGIPQVEWARTNNPSADFFFDRYTSQLRNFSVTIPNTKHSTWERYFGVGVNDRFNSGDYFCYPDDALVFRSRQTSQVYYLYLGLMEWKRQIRSSKGTLEVEFVYKGKPELAPEARHPSNLQGSATDNWIPPSDITLALSKKYIFRTDSDSAQIFLSAEVTSKLGYDAAWVVQDAAYMDFVAGNSIAVHSLIDGVTDKGGVWRHTEQAGTQPTLNKPMTAVQYRERTENESLASAFIAHHADITFALPLSIVWPFISGWFTAQNIPSTPGLEPFSIPKPLDSALIFGKVFIFPINTEFKADLMISWTSGFPHESLNTLPNLLNIPGPKR